MKNLIHTLIPELEPVTVIGSRKAAIIGQDFFWDIAEMHGYNYVGGNKNGHSRTYKKGKTVRGSNKIAYAEANNFKREGKLVMLNGFEIVVADHIKTHVDPFSGYEFLVVD